LGNPLLPSPSPSPLPLEKIDDALSATKKLEVLFEK